MGQPVEKSRQFCMRSMHLGKLLIRTHHQCSLCTVNATQRENVLTVLMVRGKQFFQVLELIAAFLRTQQSRQCFQFDVLVGILTTALRSNTASAS